jgi:nicotinamide-nucleotide amidase
MRRVIILAIGNELLIGETLDTNTNWLCRLLNGLGAGIERAVLLPDLIEPISKEIQAACDSSIDLLITTGGLGPTDDDLTLTAVAQAIGRPLDRNETAYSWLEERYSELAASGFVASAEMNQARIKMAILPTGALPIKNPVGAAPAIEVVYKNTTIICLPGVPGELKGIVTGPLQPRLAELFGAGSYQERELWVGCGDESILAPILREIIAAHPSVYIKSKANKFGPELRFKIKLHARGDSLTISKALDEAEATLRSSLAAHCIKVLENR